MIVTPFGDLDYQSHPMTLQWIAAHGVRHQTLRGELSRRGFTLSPTPLFGQPSLEWGRIHYLNHMAMLRFMQPDTSISVNSLSANPDSGEVLFYNWHHMHNLLHTRLDQALKVV